VGVAAVYMQAGDPADVADVADVVDVDEPPAIPVRASPDPGRLFPVHWAELQAIQHGPSSG
jgi:hypothetical protein